MDGASNSVWHLNVRLAVDFSQFRIKGDLLPGDRVRKEDSSSVGLALSTALGEEWFVTIRQHADLAVEVAILDTVPKVDQSADEVVDVPYFSTERTVILGYDESMGVSEIPLMPRSSYRLRYSISNLQVALSPFVESQDPPKETYRVEFWPESRSAPRVRVSNTTWGQFTQFDFAIKDLAQASNALPEADRLVAFVRDAVEIYPGGAPAIANVDQLTSMLMRQVWVMKVPKPTDEEFRELVAVQVASAVT